MLVFLVSTDIPYFFAEKKLQENQARIAVMGTEQVEIIAQSIILVPVRLSRYTRQCHRLAPAILSIYDLCVVLVHPPVQITNIRIILLLPTHTSKLKRQARVVGRKVEQAAHNRLLVTFG